MSTKYAEYKQLNLTQISDEILQKWQKEGTFEECLKLREGAKHLSSLKVPLLQTDNRAFIT